MALMCTVVSYAQTGGPRSVKADTVSVQVYFDKGSSKVDTSFRDNGFRLDAFKRDLQQKTQNGAALRSMVVTASASPDGIYTQNKKLSQERAEQILSWIDNALGCVPEEVSIRNVAVDWDGLAAVVRGTDMPWKDEALDLIENFPGWVHKDGRLVDSRKRRLMRLRHGDVWRWMDIKLFPELRQASVQVALETVVPEPEPEVTEEATPAEVPAVYDTVLATSPTESNVHEPQYRDPWLRLGTNLLYDAAAVPNLNVEFNLGRRWTLTADWGCAWWKSPERNRFWQTYGGYLGVRKYFGKASSERVFAGHHLGVYASALTYDVELGGRGWQAARFGFGGGVEYGYSLPIGRRLFLDVSVGLGYQGGEYKTYEPADGHYVWLGTYQRHWFGPTKAEIGLKWSIGGKTKEGRR